jgi:hypothetical protein
MTKSEGKCRIDGVLAGELEINALNNVALISVKYALISTESGERYGQGHINQKWSPKTMEKLKDLLASIEEDICQVVFGEGPTTASVDPGEAPTSDGVSSL